MVDSATGGAGDRIFAGVDSLVQGHDLSGYDQALAQQKARSAYDAQNRQVAQVTGQVAGMAAPLLAPELGVLRVGTRLPGALALTARQVATLAGGAGLTNAGVQRLANLASGRGVSFGDDLGAAVGGAAGVLVLPTGISRSAAVDGAVTAAAQDLFNGRPISLPGVSQGASLARFGGALAGKLGAEWSGALSNQAKGRLGERIGTGMQLLGGRVTRRGEQALNKARTFVGVEEVPVASPPANPNPRTGELKMHGDKVHDFIEGTNKSVIPDDWAGEQRLDYKFGKSAKKTPNQRVGYPLLGDRLELYHYLPRDVGAAAAVPAAGLGGVIAGVDNPRRSRPAQPVRSQHRR
jgi:hypothetical protein